MLLTISYYCVAILVGAPVITDPIEFTLDSAVDAATPMFTLTCTSTGGPATEVIWTLDGSPASGTESQTVTDTLSAIYSNTLTVTGRLTGDYQCSVTNDRNTSPATQTLSVTGECDNVGIEMQGFVG